MVIRVLLKEDFQDNRITGNLDEAPVF
jgi:hypothetical protein